MKKFMQLITVAAMILAVGIPGAWAASVDDVDTVTLTVPTILSISDETGNFTLTFTSAANGGTTNFQTVGYAVRSNNMPNSELTGALSARINALRDGINIRALGARAYTNNGSASNAVLVEDPAGPVTVGTSLTDLMRKPALAGASGRILSGTAFVAWQAQATRDLTAADSGSVTLTVTLKDA